MLFYVCVAPVKGLRHRNMHILMLCSIKSALVRETCKKPPYKIIQILKEITLNKRSEKPISVSNFRHEVYNASSVHILSLP